MVGIGSTKQIRVIEITQSRDSNGRNVEVEGPNYDMWAAVKRKGSGFDYRSGLTNLEETIEFITYFRFNFKPDSTYKVLYLGNRHQVKNIERINEQKFNWRIVAEAKHA